MEMIMKKINKKIIKNILNKFPNSDIHDLIIFEEFFFGLESLDNPENNQINKNYIIGNLTNIFIYSQCNENLYIQELNDNLIIISPNDFLIPDFDDLVKINYKNFKSYLLFNQLNSNLPQKIKSSQLKI